VFVHLHRVAVTGGDELADGALAVLHCPGPTHTPEYFLFDVCGYGSLRHVHCFSPQHGYAA
jgi:hypothetical protein